jgi:hypothetical protein
MADATARNARLQALVQATQTWGTKQTAVLQNQVTTLTNILQGRTGSASLANNSVAATTPIVIDSINSFLTG